MKSLSPVVSAVCHPTEIESARLVRVPPLELEPALPIQATDFSLSDFASRFPNGLDLSAPDLSSRIPDGYGLVIRKLDSGEHVLTLGVREKSSREFSLLRALNGAMERQVRISPNEGLGDA